MSHSVEKKENNSAIVTIKVGAEELKKAIDKAYNKAKTRIQVPGFRKGKAPKNVIEKLYGPEVFYEDAINIIVPEKYDEYVKDEKELEIVSQPRITIGEINLDNGFEFTAEVALKPSVVLGKYMNIDVPYNKVLVSDEDVNKKIDKELDNNARIYPIEDEGAKMGDICNINFDGKIDGEAFAGGKGESYPLTLGSKAFIPGFEEQLVGVKAGEDKLVEVTFPEDYHSKDLAGKKAEFSCHVNDIKRKELPTLDDDFVKDVSEFDTVEEYKADIRKKLEEDAEKRNKQEKENALLEIIVEDSNSDIHELMLETQADRIINDHRNRLSQNGLNLEQYLQLTGMSMDSLKTNAMEQAKIQIKTRLVLEEIAKAENIQVSDDELNKKLEETAKAYNLELDKLKEILSDEAIDNIKEDMKIEKAIELVMSSATDVEKKDN